ncbi:MAG: class I SAM-dependent methyltransferase [Planctomycetota bacterium]|nr:class I SAM-dependent methyltransferase [Planctomycetota bacterium]
MEKEKAEKRDDGIYRENLYKQYTEHLKSTCGIKTEEMFGGNRDITFRKYYLPHLPKDKNAKILELGCGYGAFLLFLKQQGYTNLIGVDISPQQVETAHKLGLQKEVLVAGASDFGGYTQNLLAVAKK